MAEYTLQSIMADTTDAIDVVEYTAESIIREYTVLELFGYMPDLGAAYATALAFVFLGITLMFINRRFAPCNFMVVLVLAAGFEALGYALRIVSAHFPSLVSFIVPSLFILLTPNAIAFINYMVLGRALAFRGLNVSSHRIVSSFMTSGIVSFALQGLGGCLVTSSTEAVHTGQRIVLAGLAIQVLTLSLFIFTLVRIQQTPQHGLSGTRDGRMLFISLYATTVLLLVRSIFRITEYAAGKTSYVTMHEWVFYVLEAMPILGTLLLHIVEDLHYGRVMNKLASQVGFDAWQVMDSKAAGCLGGSQHDTQVKIIIAYPDEALCDVHGVMHAKVAGQVEDDLSAAKMSAQMPKVWAL
mmetsp:Transcript_17315/g.29577  ORF Transcript_17315/g.29577 Transcript_17315/m.29577 type:complete len:355 (-) Transcript_17315:718-1782(-)|eukprot:CAMPEP_0119107256 /NCGR_PEP_ID=MMETSP1180-20130426/9598_1 /TAXON_ID=3052 ORGANISM="Chlamydomonas cf sp, Strain CCMP681" /NCGR_SAMPLE_ID=MMETSP1180 /ASSEMBLY_ACC=CAM_ASM_000741 /LENGTH=354 /DNA_ID=CAMNT_0007092717 /DNA_START=176 /DNA_END=1240 /DNA_ORIENTATION=-